ncbi:hypothetical protein B0H11DRAFT_2049879 [Mycena galericulata]|nr:hypothetical protein B0H11DRAFT_2049879 [Mycena galericulata]
MHRCADLYKDHPERIKDVVKSATEDAAELRGEIKCQWWPGCEETLSTEHGALWTHLQERHGIMEGVKEVCCYWTGCSAKVQSNSLVQHVKSVHFKLRLKCPTCTTTFGRVDTLKRHLYGQR